MIDIVSSVITEEPQAMSDSDSVLSAQPEATGSSSDLSSALLMLPATGTVDTKRSSIRSSLQSSYRGSLINAASSKEEAGESSLQDEAEGDLENSIQVPTMLNAAAALPSEVEERVVHYIQSRTAGSPFFQSNPPKPLPVFDIDEIIQGQLLGQGEFGSVRELHEIFDKAGHDGLNKLAKASIDNSQTTDSSRHSVDYLGLVGGAPASRSLAKEDDSALYFEKDASVLAFGNSNEQGKDNKMGGSNINRNDNEGSIEFVDVESTRLARKALKRRCWRDGKARYAIKQLRPELVEGMEGGFSEDNSDELDIGAIGAMDLAMEATLLASLSHSNICKLRGTAGIPGSPDFMLVLDRLYVTLDDQIEEWRQEQPRKSRVKQIFGKLPKLFPRSMPLKKVSEGDAIGMTRPRNKAYDAKSNTDLLLRKGQLLHRLYAAYDVARALKYLHQHQIVYRDLKPQNIALDIRGDVRIFDFGMAKELLETARVGFPDSYNATGMCGSRRWMAPEVYFSDPYGLSADVYSFGLLLWNLCYLRTPYGDGLTLKSHHMKVMVKGERPQRVRSRIVSDNLWSIMRMCWSSDREERPSFETIAEVLRQEISNMRVNIQLAVGTDPTADASVQSGHTRTTAPSSSSRSLGRKKLTRGKSANVGTSMQKLFVGGNKQQSSKRLQDPCNVSWHHAPGKVVKTKRGRVRGRKNKKPSRGHSALRMFKHRNSDLEDRSEYLMNKSLQSMAMLMSSTSLHSSKGSRRDSHASLGLMRDSYGSRIHSNHPNESSSNSPATRGQFAFGESANSMVSAAASL